MRTHLLALAVALAFVVGCGTKSASTVNTISPVGKQYVS